MTIHPFSGTRNGEPYPLACWDIETSNKEGGKCIGSGFAWTTADGVEHYISHPDSQSFIRWLLREIKRTPKKERKRLTTIYAHNGFGFDYERLLSDLEEAGFIDDGEIIQTKSHIVGINISVNKGTRLHLRDSMRLLPGKLSDVLGALGVEQQKLNLGDKLPEEIKEENPDLFWEYLEHDVRGLHQAIYTFWEMIYNLFGPIGPLPMTLPSVAFRLWQKRLEYPIFVPTYDSLKAVERRAYKGGRVSCFHRGVFDVTTFDANSHYPAVMIQCEVPISQYGGWTDTYEGLDGVYTVRFSQGRRDLPPLLFCDEKREFAYEGVGAFYAPELRKLVELDGEVEVIGESFVFSHMGHLFECVEEWYSMRKEAKENNNSALSFILKILMNSLYGKFGTSEEGTKTLRYDEKLYQEYVAEGIEPQVIGNWMQIPEKRRSGKVFVSIAGYITSNARVRLYNEIQRWEERGHRVIYCDTDSVHVEGIHDMIPSNDLGVFSPEYRGKGAYVGRKMYGHEGGDKVTLKGVGYAERQRIGYKTMVAMANDPQYRVETDSFAFPTLWEAIRGKYQPNEPITRKRRVGQV